MYKVEIDRNKKLIRFDVNGFLKMEEAVSLEKEFTDALKSFKPKEAFMLGNMKGFKPATPDVAPVLQKMQGKGIEHFKKIAIVHDSVLAQMQFKRIGDEVNANTTIARFATEEEAMKYLFE